MKISTWHKAQGNTVEFIHAGIAWTPSREKKPFIVPSGYDEIYCSVVFSGSKAYIIDDMIGKSKIFYGGSGHDLTTKLSPKIEACAPDYSIYPENDCNYGFITRGCIRKCSFCIVSKKEGGIHLYSSVEKIIAGGFDKTRFLDNNILSYKGHIEILQELVNKKIYHQFNQGLDVRLLTKENADLLKRTKHFYELTFAFDNWAYLPLIEKKLPLLDGFRKWGLKFYVYVHPDMPLSDTIKRVEYLRERKIHAYVMRDIACYGSKYHMFYTKLAEFANNGMKTKKINFQTFLHHYVGDKQLMKVLEDLYLRNR